MSADAIVSPSQTAHDGGTTANEKLIRLDFTHYDILQVLEQLHDMACNGQLSGLLVAAKCVDAVPSRNLFVSAGRFVRNPEEALGVATLLQAEIARRAGG